MPFQRPHEGSSIGAGRIVANGDLTGTVTSDVMNTKGIVALAVMVKATRPGAGMTQVQMFSDYSFDGVEFFPLQDEDPAGLLDKQVNKTITAGDTIWATSVDLIAPFTRLRFTASAPMAGDVITVDAFGR